MTDDDPEQQRLRAQVEALRGEVDALREENATLRDGTAPPFAATPRRRRGGRAVAAVLALTLGAVLVVPAVVTSWARGVLTDTDRYLATVAPLADDPRIQQAIEARATEAITEAIRLDDRVDQIIDAVAGLDVPPAVATAVQALRAPLTDAARGVVRDAVQRVVQSDAFSDAWREANRVAHTQLVGVLEGDPDALAQLDEDGTLSVPLGPVIDEVRDRLVARGFTLVEGLPTIDVSYPLLVSADLVRVQQGYRLLDVLGATLVWVALGLLAVGVLLSRDRARAVVVAGAVLVAGGVLLGLSLTIARSVYLDALAGVLRRPDAALAAYDQVVAFLRVAGRTTVALGALAVLAGVVAGRGATATRVRGQVGRGSTALLGRGGARTARVAAVTARWRVALLGAIGVVGVLALVLPDRLTPGYVAVIGLVALG
jgi:hypothetical protein